jgi:hypothetical protein
LPASAGVAEAASIRATAASFVPMFFIGVLLCSAVEG